MEKKRISRLAIASFIISICSGVVPLFSGFIGGYYRIPTFPPMGYLGIILGVCSIILGISALAIISKNKSTLSGYARAIVGIIIGLFSSYAWINMIIYMTHRTPK